MMMQQLDTHGSVEGTSGLYGSLYDVVIRDVLKDASENPAEIEVVVNYLTEFAFFIFESKSLHVEEKDYVDWHHKYCDIFNSKLIWKEVLVQLEAIGIFRRQEVLVGFKYKYYYWYFVAKYLANYMHQSNTIDIIKVMSDTLYLDDSANIMLFLCHLSKDPRILEMILDKTKAHFITHIEYDLTKSPKVLPSGAIRAAHLELSTASPEEEKLKHLRHQDDVVRPNGISEVGSFEDAQHDKEVFELVNQINAALHSIRISGQIIRNFYGSMRGDVQVAVIQECYKLCLRMIGVLFEQMENDKDTIASTVADILHKREPTLVGEELDKKVRRSVQAVAMQICYGLIKHTSNSLGLSALSTSFDKIANDSATTVSQRILDLSTRLDFFDAFPEPTIMKITETIEKNVIGHEVLRILVWEHFKLFRRDFKTRQRVCSKLNIKCSDLSFSDPKDKKVVATK
jgi:hypothetical protein